MLSYTESENEFVNITNIKSEILGVFYNSIEAEKHQQLVKFIIKKTKDPSLKYITEIHPLTTNEPNYTHLLSTYTNAFHPELSPDNDITNQIYPKTHDKEFEALYNDLDISNS